MSTTIVRETWKPLCGNTLEGLHELLRIRADRCRRKRNHRGRCVGRYLVWNKVSVMGIQKKLEGTSK
jgi:hypothetical protein